MKRKNRKRFLKLELAYRSLVNDHFDTIYAHNLHSENKFPVPDRTDLLTNAGLQKTSIMSVALFVALGFTTLWASAQKVYQNGNYNGQQQHSYLKLYGTVKEKYTSKGFNWLKISAGGKESVINMVSVERFNLVKVDSLINLDSCFMITSNKWKLKKS